LACSLLLKIYFLSERPIDCPLYFPRLLFFVFFLLFYDASLPACYWQMGLFCKFASGNICAHKLLMNPKKRTKYRRWQTLPLPLSLSLSLFPHHSPNTTPRPPFLKGGAKQTQARELEQCGHALSHVWVPWHVWARLGVSTIPIHDTV
jgi:hypothetical protein